MPKLLMNNKEETNSVIKNVSTYTKSELIKPQKRCLTP